jgi:hypothetical protein
VESSNGGDGVKRWIFTILLFLLLVSGGAIVNIAVAWVHPWVYRSCGGHTTWMDGHSLEGRGLYLWIVSRRSGIGFDQVVSTWNPPQCGFRLQGSDMRAEELVPAWAESARPSGDYGNSLFVTRLLDARGWPMLALRSHVELLTNWDSVGLTVETVQTVRSGHLLADYSIGYLDLESVHALPVDPIWPGFLINTLFYAIIVWLLIVGPLLVRRLVRIRRGRCPKCGYDLRGQPPEPEAAGGPECGWGRETILEAMRD